MPNIQMIARLSYGEGAIGTGKTFESPEAQAEFEAALNRCIVPITHPNTADCVDGRRTIALADGTEDPNILDTRVTHQLPGGLVLPITKAAKAADLAILRDSNTLQNSYEIMYTLLTELGLEDGGHVGCGASAKVKQSVVEKLPDEALLSTLPAIRPIPGNTTSLLAANWSHQWKLVENNYYDGWSSSWHESFLADKVPQNFSTLEADHNHPTHSHDEEGAALISVAGYGFAKNQFINATAGRQVFGETTHTGASIVERVIHAVGGSQLERERMLLALDTDTPQVLNQLIAPDFAVFA